VGIIRICKRLQFGKERQEGKADEIRGSKQPLGFQSRDMNVFKGLFQSLGNRRSEKW
jgi:hypothetical protein